MANIKIMDELLANKIAAGEVVERCASVVKELVENSIDAGSTQIQVDLIESGVKQIQVSDNGSGMEKEDALMAFHRHATSKLLSERDLFHIATLGFRGEALASIASVSKVELKTSTGEKGIIVKINGGKRVGMDIADARCGTTITVSDLFYNTPARLKHMKSLYTELSSITDYMNKLALSHPDISFVLTNNSSVLLNTDGSGNLLKVIRSIYGLDLTKKMLEVAIQNDDYIISGYISAPEVYRSNRNHMTIIVNGRVVKNMDLNRVINDTYHSYKPDNRYPVVVLCIETDPSLVDVNIHPTKMDIKFSKLDQLLLLIQKMIEARLLSKQHVPKVEPVKPILAPYEEIPISFDQVLETEEPLLVANDFFDETDVVAVATETEKAFPNLYPIGLVHGTYIVCQNEQGMYLIDQHAAKERVNYEYYKEKLGHPVQEQIAMIFPLTMEFTNSEFLLLSNHLRFLRELKFDVAEFGVNSFLIKAHPTWLPKGYEQEAIRHILELIISLGESFDLVKFNEQLAINLSCKLAIKANTDLSLLEMEHLICDLTGCQNPYHCPHGRPTMVFYSSYDLEKQFKRSGF